MDQNQRYPTVFIGPLPLEFRIPSKSAEYFQYQTLEGDNRQLGRERKIVTCEALWNVQWRLTVSTSDTTNNASLHVVTLRQVALRFADVCIKNIKFCQGRASVLDTNF